MENLLGIRFFDGTAVGAAETPCSRRICSDKLRSFLEMVLQTLQRTLKSAPVCLLFKTTSNLYIDDYQRFLLLGAFHNWHYSRGNFYCHICMTSFRTDKFVSYREQHSGNLNTGLVWRLKVKNCPIGKWFRF